MKWKLLSTIIGCCTATQVIADPLQAISDFVSKIDVSGRIMLDYEKFDGLHNNNEEDSEFSVRRASMRFGYDQSEQWEVRIKLGYGEDEDKFEIQDVQLTAKLFDDIELSIGKFKEPIGLEYSTSSRDLLMMERTMMTEAFVPRRNIGLELSGKEEFNGGGQSWAIGVFDNDREESFSSAAVSGRYNVFLDNKKNTWPRWFAEKSVLHLGISGTYRHEKPEYPIRINERVEVYSADTIVESNRIDAENQSVIGLEAGISIGPVNLQAEQMRQKVEAKSTSNDVDSWYSGSYVQVGWFLTGQTLRYDDNRFEGVRPRSSEKVWLLVARYSEIDARDNDRGSEARNVTLGLNYYHNRHFKFMLNLSRADLSGRNAIFADEGEALTFRAQYWF